MLMNEDEKTLYLANVLRIAFADKSLSARETAALEEVRKSVDAKKGILASAQKAVESGSYALAKVGSFADQVRNLEDMLFVALVDQDLNESENVLVCDFARLISLTQAQVDQLVTETSRRCDAANHEVACPSCSKSVSAQARFCPSCGQALASADAASVQTGFEIPKAGYAIEFCESTAGTFASALDLAKATGKIQTATKNKRIWYMVTFPTSAFADMVPIASSLSGMRNRKVHLDGQELAWDEVFGFIWCATQRAAAFQPIEYCFGKDENRINPWGCRQARMEWTEWARWFSYGRWQGTASPRGGSAFVFDKERIRHELSTNLYRYRFCPHLRPLFIEALLNRFPEQAEVTPDGKWKYNRVYEALPGTIKVIEREGSGDFVCTNEYYSDGVRPRGYALLADLLKKAFDECRVTDVGATALLTK
jgi:hypothetical protein